jgi:hypothetical protein
MALISNIGAGIFTKLKYKADSTYTLPTTDGEHQTFITASTGDFDGATEVSGIREFPTFGKPANIVNVPQYGQSISSQISGQSDAPTLEFSLNYIPGVHNTLQGLVGDGSTYVFMLDVKNTTTGDNAAFYVKGQVASFEVTPSLTDSNQATLTLTTSTDYAGPFTDA